MLKYIMGTHIDCIIPKEKSYSVAEIKSKLKSVYNRLQSEYLHLEENGSFTKKPNGDWWILLVPSEYENPEYITGEGDSFRIDIYEKVIHIGCVERFSSLYLEDKNISSELFKIINEIGKAFRKSDELLLAAGGFGDTDHILEMAFLEEADFNEICKKMYDLHGIPATTLTALKDKSWFLKK
ncbi:hypothetical protein [Flavobacterium profundi]|nr:hypothetical protein [Flavobacterium profundi]